MYRNLASLNTGKRDLPFRADEAASLQVAHPENGPGRLDDAVLAGDREISQVYGARAVAAESHRALAEREGRAGEGAGDGDKSKWHRHSPTRKSLFSEISIQWVAAVS